MSCPGGALIKKLCSLAPVTALILYIQIRRAHRFGHLVSPVGPRVPALCQVLRGGLSLGPIEKHIGRRPLPCQCRAGAIAWVSLEAKNYPARCGLCVLQRFPDHALPRGLPTAMRFPNFRDQQQCGFSSRPTDRNGNAASETNVDVFPVPRASIKKFKPDGIT
jgi:hypothetical protein